MDQRNCTRFLMSRDTELQVEVETWHFNNTNTPNRMHPSSTLAENCSKVFEPGLNLSVSYLLMFKPLTAPMSSC